MKRAVLISTASYFMTTISVCAIASSKLSTYPCRYGKDGDANCENEHAICGVGHLCQCRDGFVGDGFSCIEDGCLNATCHSSASCEAFLWYDALLELRASFRCVCEDGWIGDGMTCHPNPCAAGRHNCHEQAVCMLDLEGVEFSCFCKEGLMGNGTSCYPDICKTNGSMCQAPNEVCRSTGPDSFDCECAQDYFLQDGVCRSDPCAPENHNCSQNSLCSANLDGSYTCICSDNFYRISATECKAHACLTSTDTCSIDAVCQPLYLESGSLTSAFTCQCKTGYYGDGFTCNPDPCVHGTHNCDQNSTCISEGAGKFYCLCSEMYYAEQGVCKLHPCFQATKPCHMNAWCVSSPAEDGSYSCMCIHPFEGNGTFCKLVGNATCAEDQFTCPKTGRCIPLAWTLDGINDCSEGEDEKESLVDECLTGKHRCHPLATCVNDPNGSYECQCRQPFFGDGLNCGNETLTTTLVAVGIESMSIMSTTSPNLSTKFVDCAATVRVFRCKSSPDVCVSQLSILDGVADCPESDDEKPEVIEDVEECEPSTNMFGCDERVNCSLLMNGLCYCALNNNTIQSRLCRPSISIAAETISSAQPSSTSHWRDGKEFRSRVPGKCGNTTGIIYFDCNTTDQKCIPLTKFHDGTPDCPDGSDEWCFVGYVNCGPYCVLPKDASECSSDIKQKLCPLSNSVPCKGYGECVLRSWLLDGKQDCMDGSDEDPTYASEFLNEDYGDNNGTDNGNNGNNNGNNGNNNGNNGNNNGTGNGDGSTGGNGGGNGNGNTGGNGGSNGNGSTGGNGGGNGNGSTGGNNGGNGNGSGNGTGNGNGSGNGGTNTTGGNGGIGGGSGSSANMTATTPSSPANSSNQGGSNSSWTTQPGGIISVPINPDGNGNSGNNNENVGPGNKCYDDALAVAKSKFGSSPICPCKPGLTMNPNGECLPATLGSVQFRALQLCGQDFSYYDKLGDPSSPDFQNYAFLMANAISDALKSAGMSSAIPSICVPSVAMKPGSVLVTINLQCINNSDSCSTSSLKSAIEQQASNASVRFDPNVIVAVDACADNNLKGCDANAVCTQKSFSYSCACPDSYNDTSPDPAYPGRICVSNVDTAESICTNIAFLGMCLPLLLFIIIILVLIAILLLLLYLLWRCCCSNRGETEQIAPLGDPQDAQDAWSNGSKKTGNSAGNNSAGMRTDTDGRALEEAVVEETQSNPATANRSTFPSLLKSNQIIDSPEHLKSVDIDSILSPDLDADQQQVEAVIEDRPPTNLSGGTPTIWETYRKLGQQYARFSTAKTRKSTGSSLHTGTAGLGTRAVTTKEARELTRLNLSLAGLNKINEERPDMGDTAVTELIKTNSQLPADPSILAAAVKQKREDRKGSTSSSHDSQEPLNPDGESRRLGVQPSTSSPEAAEPATVDADDIDLSGIPVKQAAVDLPHHPNAPVYREAKVRTPDSESSPRRPPRSASRASRGGESGSAPSRAPSRGGEYSAGPSRVVDSRNVPSRAGDYADGSSRGGESGIGRPKSRNSAGSGAGTLPDNSIRRGEELDAGRPKSRNSAGSGGAGSALPPEDNSGAPYKENLWWGHQ